MPDTSVATGDQLIIAGKAYSSRLIVGTGKYANYAQNAAAAEAAGAEPGFASSLGPGIDVRE